MQRPEQKIRSLIHRVVQTYDSDCIPLTAQLFAAISNAYAQNPIWIEIQKSFGYLHGVDQTMAHVGRYRYVLPSEETQCIQDAYSLYKTMCVNDSDGILVQMFPAQTLRESYGKLHNKLGPYLSAGLDRIVESEPNSDAVEILRGTAKEMGDCGLGQNPKFDDDERQSVLDKLSELESALHRRLNEMEGHLDAQDDRLQEINNRIRALREAAEKMGKKDWFCLAMGTLFSLTLSGILPGNGTDGPLGLLK